VSVDSAKARAAGAGESNRRPEGVLNSPNGSLHGAVLRWEYAPGSTFYLVWKQGRDVYEERESATNFDASLVAGDLFDNEPENVILAKLTYWFSM
jgi:hypothetical protein